MFCDPEKIMVIELSAIEQCLWYSINRRKSVTQCVYIDLFLGKGGRSLNIKVKTGSHYLKMDFIVLGRICFLYFSVMWLYFFINEKI